MSEHHQPEPSATPASPSGGFVALAELTRGKPYWRSMDQALNATDPGATEPEWAHGAPREMQPLPRREFLRVMGATVALAGASGCGIQPAEKIVPYVNQPEHVVPGKPRYFATAFTRSGYAVGVLGESHMGRPVKLEGNPEHPASLGATDSMTQAAVLALYDPDRSQAVRHQGSFSTFNLFLGDMVAGMEALREARGRGLCVITGYVTSPTLEYQLRRLLAAYPEARITVHEPVDRENVMEGCRLAFGERLEPVYDFSQADVILSLDSDFMMDEPGRLRYARDWAARRRVRDGDYEMNRLYMVESGASPTGAMADHRVAVKPSLVDQAARTVAVGLGVTGAGAASPEGIPPAWLQAVVADLQSHRGRSLVIAGAQQPPAVHALAQAINSQLGNVGRTVSYIAPVPADFGAQQQSLASLTGQMTAGDVNTLLILDSNPVYTAPADLKFAEAMEVVPLRIHMGLYDDETAALSHWHLPMSHFLESWGDATAYDGTISVVQPLIRPLYDTRSAIELVAGLLGEGDRGGYEICREYWSARHRAGGPPPTPASTPARSARRVQRLEATPAFEKYWHALLDRGAAPNTRSSAATVGSPALAKLPAPAAAAALELVFRADASVWDGSYSNNSWLQELPRPMSTLTWDNAAIFSPSTARTLGVADGDMVELNHAGRALTAAALVQPGQPDSVVGLHLGYGRTRAGRVGNKTGFNAYALRTSAMPWGGEVQVARADGRYPLARTQTHFNMEGRRLVQAGGVEALKASPDSPAFVHHEHGGQHTLFPDTWPSDYLGGDQRERPEGEAAEGGHGAAGGHARPDWSVPESAAGVQGYNGHPVPAWGMVIDLTSCVGCNACTIACQAENNISTVGKEQVLVSREMHWLRIDTYYAGMPDQPDGAVFQPVACQHCEKAPCEPVCPVEATSHSVEGINEMTYNRCIGTRYCSNNCPYKVRRFNFLQYADQKTPVVQLMRNPDVTVRSRGVMEKCTYCVQRVNQARISAELDGRQLQDGDVVTACQQVCPTQAIVFGDLRDEHSDGGHGSEARRLKMLGSNYNILNELNTRPRTSYLARINNPHPQLAPTGAAGGHGGE